MSLLLEMRSRRVPQYISAYIVAGWGIIQFATFLESRLLFSPHLVNLIGLALILLLPSVAVLAWRHGRPGRDTWGRSEKITLPVNLLAAAALLLVLFSDKDLGAVTQTVRVQDENGAVTERSILKNEYRPRVQLNYLRNDGPVEDDWLQQGFAMLLAVDLAQSPSLDIGEPAQNVQALRHAGHEDGLDLPPSLQRKLARDGHYPHFLAGTFARTGATYRLTLELHETENGRIVATRNHTGDDIYALVDDASNQLRGDLGLPEGLQDGGEDLPVNEMLTAKPEALEDFVEGLVLVAHRNQWSEARAPLQRAIELDPGFAMAHYIMYAVHATTGDMSAATASMAAAVDNLYRLPERIRFQIKCFYYYNVKEEPDKAMAVLHMWSQLYPSDVAAYKQQTFFYRLRHDYTAGIEACERILEIDPSQHETLVDIAGFYQELGDNEQAETYLLRYAELYPRQADSYVQLADLYDDSGRLEEARSALERAQLLEPARMDIELALVGIDRRQGNYAEAEETLSRLLDAADQSTERSRILREVQRVCLTRGQISRARETLDAMFELTAELLNPQQRLLQYAMLMSSLVEAGHAAAVLDRLTEIRTDIPAPNDRIVDMCEGPALITLGRLDEAGLKLARTGELIDQYKLELLRPQLQLVEGQLALVRGDLELALELFSAALEGDPNSQRAAWQTGRVQRLLGKRQAAEGTLTGVLTKNPAHPVSNLEMALLRFEQGRSAESRDHLARSLAAWQGADPDHERHAEALALQRRLDETP